MLLMNFDIFCNFLNPLRCSTKLKDLNIFETPDFPRIFGSFIGFCRFFCHVYLRDCFSDLSFLITLLWPKCALKSVMTKLMMRYIFCADFESFFIFFLIRP